VAELIRTFRPTLVVFDNAGRTAQLRAAVDCAARVIFVSSRSRQRRKAFRLRWMRMLDEHWIAYPEFIAGSLGPLERLKLRLLGRPSVKFLDAVLPPADAAVAASMMAKFNIASGDYVLVVPGGGTDHPGAENAPQIVAAAASQIAERGFPTVLVGVAPIGHTSRRDDAGKQLRLAQRMPMSELAELIRGARLVLSNGGDTLLQAIAAARPCIAVPIAGDQAHRIERCARAGLAISAKLDASALAKSALGFLDDDYRRATFTARLQSAAVTNGMEVALTAIGRLATPR
jgi:hypothetical protein